MEAYRGDIFYINAKEQSDGSVQTAGRPAVIVSNDKANENSQILEIVYLTTQPKKDLPTHCLIRSANKPSTALCEQVQTINKDRLGNFCNECTKEEMNNIDRCLLISLGISDIQDITASDTPKVQKEHASDSEVYLSLNNVIKELYIRESSIKRIFCTCEDDKEEQK